MFSTLFPLAGIILGINPADTAVADSRCGAYCLQVALKALGRAPNTLSDLEVTLGRPGPSGYSMAQLNEAAKNLGLQTIAVETTLERLRARREEFACIALVRDRHFLLVSDCEADRVSIIDPPKSYTLSRDAFESIWSGKALLIAASPLQPEEAIRIGRPSRLMRTASMTVGSALLIGALGLFTRRIWPQVRRYLVGILILISLGAWGAGCGGRASPGPRAPGGSLPPSLGVSPSFHELGDLLRTTSGATVEVETTLINRGGGTLRIPSIKSSCACSATSIERTELGPGQRAILRTRIKLGDSPEPRQSIQTVVSSDPRRPEVPIIFTWRAVNPLRTKPAIVDWGRLTPGNGAAQQLDIVTRGLSLCDDCQIDVTSAFPDLTGTYKSVGSRRKQLHAHVSSPNQERRVGVLTLGVAPGNASGDYREEILLRVNCGRREVASLLIPVRWSVRPVIEGIPGRLFLGAQSRGGRVSKKILVRSNEKKAFRVERVSCEGPDFLDHVSFSGSDSVEHLVELSMRMPYLSGPWRSAVRISTSEPHAGELLLPISAVLSPGPSETYGSKGLQAVGVDGRD